MFLNLIKVKSEWFKPYEVILKKKHIWIGFFLVIIPILAGLATGATFLILNSKWAAFGCFAGILPFLFLMFLLFENPKLFCNMILFIPNVIFNIVIFLPIIIGKIIGGLMKSDFYFSSLNETISINRMFLLLAILCLIALILVFLLLSPAMTLSTSGKAGIFKTSVFSFLLAMLLMFIYLFFINVRFSDGDVTNHR